MTGVQLAIFWLILSAVLFIIEGLTVQLVCIWFAVGALFAMLASLLGAPIFVQALVFLAFSIVTLIVGRPLLTKKLAVRKQATNADMVIGSLGLVLEEIDNLNQTGRVSANGLTWTARSEDGMVIEPRRQVRVLRIDGVKLIVEPVNAPETLEEKRSESTC